MRQTQTQVSYRHPDSFQAKIECQYRSGSFAGRMVETGSCLIVHD
jgi:hypothetical protein